MPVEVKRSNRDGRRARWPCMPHSKGSSCKDWSHLCSLGQTMIMHEMAIESLRGWRIGMPFGKTCTRGTVDLFSALLPINFPKCLSFATTTCIKIFEFHCAQDDLDLIHHSVSADRWSICSFIAVQSLWLFFSLFFSQASPTVLSWNVVVRPLNFSEHSNKQALIDRVIQFLNFSVC